MNILFINTANVSEGSLGGVNAVSQVIAKNLREKYGVRPFLGYYYTNSRQEVTGIFEARTQLGIPLDKEKFKQFLIEHQIDIIQSNVCKRELWIASPQVYEIAKGCNVPMLFQFHMSPLFEYKMFGSVPRLAWAIVHRKNIKAELHYLLLTKMRPFVGLLARLFLRKKYKLPYVSCDVAVMLSQYYFAPYLQVAGIKDAGKMNAIGNVLTFNASISPFEIKDKQKEVLLVCRLDDFYKNVSRALKIWKQIEQNAQFDDWKFTIVGTGQDFDFLRHYAQKLKLKRCSFEGYQNPVSYYKRASIFMMTSTSEGWPMTLMESVQMGVVPVVFDSFGALHDIVTDGENGFIIPEKNISKYVAALGKLMLSDDLRQKMAMNAVESSKRFTVENTTKQWIELFDKLIAER